MAPRNTSVLVLLLTILITSAVFASPSDPALPWIAQLNNPQLTKRKAALLQLQALGMRGAKGLILALKDSSWELRDQARAALAQLGPPVQPLLAKALSHTKARVRLQTAKTLAHTGPPSNSVIDALRKALKDREPGVRTTVAQTLTQLKIPALLPSLIQCLKDPYWMARAHCAKAIGALGKSAHSAISALLPLHRDPKEQIRFSVMKALGTIHAHPRRAIPTLARALRDPIWRVRWAAATSLGQFGKKAAIAIPSLRKAFFDNNSRIQGPTAVSLGKIGKKALSMLPTFVNRLKRDDTMDLIASRLASPLHRVFLAIQLRPKERKLLTLFSLTHAIASFEKPAVSYLRRQTFRSPTPNLWLLFTIGRMGTNARSTTRQVLRLTQHPRQEIRWVAVLVLARIAPRNKYARRALQRALNDKSKWVKVAAQQALHSLNNPPPQKNHSEAQMAAQHFLHLMRSRSSSPSLLWK